MLLPIADYVDVNDPIYTASATNAFTFGGTAYAVGAVATPVVIYYNVDLFENNGLDLPRDLYEAGEWDWAAFRDVAMALIYDSDNNGENDVYGFEIDWVPMPRGPKMDVNTGMCALTGWGIGITSANPTAAANFIKMSCEMEAAFANKNNTALYGEDAVKEMNELAARRVFVPIGIDKYWDNNWTVCQGIRSNTPVVNFLTEATEQVKSGFESTMSN